MARKTGFKSNNIPIEIIGEGITEYYYMYKLRRFISLKQYSIKYSNFKRNTGYVRLGKTIDKVIRQYEDKEVKIIVLFDLDVIKNDNKTREKLETIKSKYNNNKNILFFGSMPEIEYWFLLHFTDTHKAMSSEKCLLNLKEHIMDYKKTDKYLKSDKWMDVLMGNDNFKQAVDRAKQYSKHEYDSYTEIYKAIEFLKSK